MKTSSEKKERRDSEMSALKHLGIGAGAYVGSHAAATAGSLGLLLPKPSLLKSEELHPHTSGASARRLAKAIAPNTPFRVHKGGAGQHAFYIPPEGRLERLFRPTRERGLKEILKSRLKVSDQEAERIVVKSRKIGFVSLPSRGPGIGAHEFGHSANTRTFVGKALNVGRRVSPLVQSASLLTALAADPESSISKYSPLAAAASNLPTLAEEGLASWKGIRGMRKAKFAPKHIGTAKGHLARAFGTYALSTLPLAGTAYGLRRARMAIRDLLDPNPAQAIKKTISAVKKAKHEIVHTKKASVEETDMDTFDVFMAGFVDELEKLGVTFEELGLTKEQYPQTYKASMGRSKLPESKRTEMTRMTLGNIPEDVRAKIFRRTEKGFAKGPKGVAMMQSAKGSKALLRQLGLRGTAQTMAGFRTALPPGSPGADVFEKAEQRLEKIKGRKAFSAELDKPGRFIGLPRGKPAKPTFRGKGWGRAFRASMR